MSFKGHARRIGRRWVSLDPPGKRGKTYYRVLGTCKLCDILSNAEGDKLMAAIDAGRVRYEQVDESTHRIIVLDEETPSGCAGSDV